MFKNLEPLSCSVLASYYAKCIVIDACVYQKIYCIIMKQFTDHAYMAHQYIYTSSAVQLTATQCTKITWITGYMQLMETVETFLLAGL